MDKKYRVLEVCVDLDGGGIDRYLFNYCTRIDDIQFDFAKVDRGIVGMLEPLLEVRGCKIYGLPPQSVDFKENYRCLRKIMTATHYDAIHVHLGYMGFLALLCAKNCGIKTRIVHAHIAYEHESFKTRIKRLFFTKLTKALATDLAACGIDAGKWVWGENSNVHIVNNSIDTRVYAFNMARRTEIRKDFNVSEDTLVVANVGRLGFQKNQLRLLEIFAEIKKLHADSQLWLIGNREYSDEEWYSKKEKLRLGNEVKEMGVRKDVPELLNAMDVFVFPSNYEGLPFTLIETQCNGLPSLSADTVTKYVKLGDEVAFMSLKDDNVKWAEKTISMAYRGHNINGSDNLIKAGYDLNTEAETLRNYYIYRIKKYE